MLKPVTDNLVCEYVFAFPCMQVYICFPLEKQYCVSSVCYQSSFLLPHYMTAVFPLLPTLPSAAQPLYIESSTQSPWNLPCQYITL